MKNIELNKEKYAEIVKNKKLTLHSNYTDPDRFYSSVYAMTRYEDEEGVLYQLIDEDNDLGIRETKYFIDKSKCDI